MNCSSSAVPSVATTIAWVSPRVKSAEPWVRGSRPVWQTIGRTSSVRRPSMRLPVLTTDVVEPEFEMTPAISPSPEESP